MQHLEKYDMHEMQDDTKKLKMLGRPTTTFFLYFLLSNFYLSPWTKINQDR